MIVTNPAEDSSTAMNINFHADLGYTSCYVQYTTTDDTSWAKAKTQTGSYVTYGASSSTNPFYNKYAKDNSGADYYQTPTFLDYSVTLGGLTKNTNYMYRISDGSAYSNTYYFKTANTGGGDWSFVVTGDFHEYHASYGVYRASQATKAINAAISLAGQVGAPAVEHIASVGDIVAWGVDYNQWQNVYNQPWVKNYSFANAIGNHDDMDRSANSSSKYNAICANYPTNGYGSEVGTCFYYVYNNVLFIYINYLDTSSTAEAWADGVVASMAGKYQYSVLINHRPATNKYTGGTYSYFWNYWSDFCDRNHIDLVLAGDHHVYMRSQPLYGGSKLSGYSASNPDATVYIAADSSDGERGSSTDVTSSWKSSIVASHYYRYDYSSSTKDKTAILVHVADDKLTTRFVYYEDSTSAANSSDFYEGSVSGHSYFYYGDTSYVYPSDHGYNSEGGGNTDINTGLPAAAKNFFAASNGGTYKYPTTNYPGGSSYYTYEYYGDNANQGGSYMTGKLNDGVVPSDASPSGETRWSVIFNSNGRPELYLKLSEKAYLNNISIIYRYTGLYSDIGLSYLGVGSSESYTTTVAYNVTKQVYSGSNYKMTITFNAPVQAQYIKILLSGPSTDATRYALGEIQVWGDTKLPVTDVPFELTDEADGGYELGESYLTLSQLLTPTETVAEQFKCEVTILNHKGEVLAEGAQVGTGCKVVKYSSDGEIVNTVDVVVVGDTDGDAYVSTSDYMLIKLFIINSRVVESCYDMAGDYDTDDAVSTTDLMLMKMYFMS